MNIRWFEFEKDLDVLTAIEAKVYENYWTIDDFKSKLKQKSVTCLVVEENEKIVGFIIYELFLYRFSILKISILPSFRNSDAGKLLLDEVVSKLTTKRKLISAEVRETDLAVQLFLKSHGFKAVEVIREYYVDTKEDAFVFEYKLEN